MTSIMVHLSWGSSPRMRGTQSRCRPCMRRTGIIPAYAGNTRPALARRSIARDHPRVCGEHGQNAQGTERQGGSSPHMRGTLCRCGLSTRRIGIIPAYAGNTCVVSTLACPSRDHPRICGEHYKHRGSITPNPGSSPHMRGTRDAMARLGSDSGIIPAYAGNTVPVALLHVVPEDHPRICGEHPCNRSKYSFCAGSSPHMRGTLAQCVVGYDFLGIIPAYAGNTYWKLHELYVRRDHPRICGEHLVSDVLFAVDSGSSPHMRGTLSSDSY